MDKQEKENSRSNEGVGRTSNSGDTQQNTGRDISHIDRQEGDMHNGELGGNFGKNEARQGHDKSEHHE